MTNHPNLNKIRNWPLYLVKFRTEHYMTQEKLADLLQISKRNVENWEQGESIPPAYLKSALDNISRKLS